MKVSWQTRAVAQALTLSETVYNTAVRYLESRQDTPVEHAIRDYILVGEEAPPELFRRFDMAPGDPWAQVDWAIIAQVFTGPI